ncbi:diguanylate cyclase [Kineococcus endophyticus]|uniref:Diguanylate cyclase n=1 Tax=Kineococcus endophyticus TaxID=1181883 RepID=A0ABV3P9Y7_9ACTN
MPEGTVAPGRPAGPGRPAVPGPASAPPPLTLGTTEPPWTVLRELGRGAGSVVHLALRGDREYAVKRQRTGHGANVGAGTRPRRGDQLETADADRTLRREAALLASVHHPGLTRVHAVAEVEGRLAMVMDAHDGTSLADLLHSPPLTASGTGADPADLPSGLLSVPATLRLLVDVCDALHALHATGLVHRDVKPANVLVTRTGRGVLVDLGVAHLDTGAPPGPAWPVEAPSDAGAGRPDGPDRRRREPGTAGAADASDAEAGALLYRSPEQAGVVRSPVDHRSDLYSVGAVLLECLTGRTPVEGADATQVRRRLARLRPLDLDGLGPDVPRPLGVLLRRLLARDPQDRPHDAAAVADELARIAADTAPDIALGRRTWTSPADGPLLERGRQTVALEAAWDGARAGSGGLVLVRGAAGSGRSVLVDRLRRRAVAQGGAAVVLDSTTSPSSPLSALRRAMAVAGLSTADVSSEATGEDEPRPQALAEELLQHAARTGPLLVVLDDTEHADASTLAVLRWVAGECSDLPLLVVLVDRVRTSEDDLDGIPGFDTARALVLEVPPLSDAAARAVVRRRLPGAVVTDSVATALVSRAAGNPGALLALLTTLLDEGGLLPDWGHWRLEHAALEAVPVAPRLLSALLRRVDELPPGHRHVLRLAAACGRSVDDDLVLRAAAPQLGADAVHAGLTAGVAARLLRALPHGRHEFWHQQVIDAVLEGVDEVERRALHARLARVLRSDTRADTRSESRPDPRAETLPVDRDALFACAHQHLRAGDAVAPADVVDACAVAGVEAARRSAPETAVALLTHAVQTAATAGLDLDPRLRRVLAACLARQGRHAEARAHLEELTGAAGDPVDRAVVLGELATVHRHERTAAGAGRALRAATDGLGALDSPRPTGPAGWCTFALTSLAVLLATVLRRAHRHDSRHRLDSAREVEQATLEGAHAVLLREAAAADLQLGRPRAAAPTAVASWVHALRARRADLVRDARWTLRAALLQAATGRLTLLPVRLPGTGSLVGRPLTPACPRGAAEVDPVILASLRLADGVRRLRRRGTWRAVADVLEEDGQWLDLPAHVAGTLAVAVERLAAGHLGAATAWHERAVRRVREDTAVPAELELLRAAVLGAKGRPGEAGDVLDALQRRADDPVGGPAGDSAGGTSGTGTPQPSPLHSWYLLLATTNWLVQQVDLTERFDAVARQVLRAARRTPLRGASEVRWALVLVVRGRIAQLRAAADAGDAGRVQDRERDVREALRALARGGVRHAGRGSAVQAAHVDVVRAAALHALGAPTRARLLLRRAEVRASRLDAPLVDHHVLLLRADLLEQTGAHPDAERLRWMATALAEKHGWVTLVQRGRADRAPTQPSGPGAAAGGSWTPAPGRRRRLLSAMRDVGHAAQVLDPQDVVRLALDQACEVLGADRAVLAVLDPDDELVVFAGRTRAGTDLPHQGPVDPAAARAARTGRPVVRGALESAAAASARGAHSADEVARSVVAVPLLVRGRRTGVLSAVSTVAQGAFGRGDVELLQLIAGQVAASLETARAARLEIEVHGAQRERDLAEAVRRVTEEVSGSLDLPTVRRRLVRSALTELGGRRAALVPVAAGPALHADPPALVAAAAAPSVREVAWSRDWQGEADCAALLESAHAVTGDGIGERRLPSRLAGLLDLATGPAAERPDPAEELPSPWLVVPLKDRTGQVAEALVLVGGPDGPAARTHVAEALAAPAAIGLENARLFAQVEHLARTDSLTGVATRGHLLRLGEQRVRRAATGRTVAVVMVDVDHFKSVNDTYGHAAGDEVLTTVARRLQHETRETDVLGRYGGEEFAVVVTSPADEAHGTLDAREVAERLRQGVRRTPVEVRGQQLQVTVSVGVAVLREGEQLTDVLARADTALYRAKDAGRDVVVVAP